MNAYTIKLPQFEGPFDLLLFFIERDELDIYNIPIAKITDDFLAYIRQLETLNIDVASEFILVAATLMRIKAKMLLPRKPIDENGNELDPREELVQRLLEYQRYKSVLDEMRQLEAIRALQNPRGNVLDELQSIATQALADADLESVTLFRLLRVFEQTLARFEDAKKKAIVHRIVRYNYTVPEQQKVILSRLKKNIKTGFEVIFGDCENRIHAIVTFLALLELLNAQKIEILAGEGFNNFWLIVGDELSQELD